MRTMLTTNTRAARPAFTMVELMIVIVIIAVAIAFGAGAYLRTIPEAEKRTAAAQMQAVAGAIQFYYQERHDYPAMRYNDVLPYTTVPSPGWPNHAGDAVPNAPQSIEACLYMVEYGSSATKALQALPAKVYRQIASDTVTEAPAGARPLHVIMDPWGNPLQYLRPRGPLPTDPTYDPNYPLSYGRLNNRVLLVSMGPDGLPGKASVNDANPAATANPDVWQDNRGDGTSENFPDPLQLGQGDDIVVQVGAIP
jgi:prepilin-type N-terminal cleavage/methylation domain-containing protein